MIKSLKGIFNLLLICFVFISFYLPLGTLGILKSVLFIMMIFVFYLLILYQKIKLKYLILVLFFFTFVSIYMLVSFLNYFFEKEVFVEAKTLIVMFFILLVFIIGNKYSLINKKKIILTSILAHAAYLFSKLFIFFMIYKGLFELNIVKFISRDFVIAFYGSIPRITINNDLFSPIFLFFLIFNKNLVKKKWIMYLSIVLILSNIILSFNRISIFFTLILFIIYTIFFKKIKLMTKAFCCLLIIFLIYATYLNKYSFFSDIFNTFANRFGAEGSLSTNEKILQYKLILNSLSLDFTKFLLGNGIGTFISNYIRYNIEGLRYGYEAFAGIIIYQFGAIGSLCLFTMSVFPFFSKNLLRNRSFTLHFMIYLIWLSHSLVNPVILSSNSAVLMGIILLSAYNNLQIARDIKVYSR